MISKTWPRLCRSKTGLSESVTFQLHDRCSTHLFATSLNKLWTFFGPWGSRSLLVPVILKNFAFSVLNERSNPRSSTAKVETDEMNGRHVWISEWTLYLTRAWITDRQTTSTFSHMADSRRNTRRSQNAGLTLANNTCFPSLGREMLSQYRFVFGPPSATLAQTRTNISWESRVRRKLI